MLVFGFISMKIREDEQMVILHIASIKENPYNGVCVIVPQHIAEQQKIADVALVNVKKKKIPNIENQFEYNSDFDIEKLPNPFSKPDIVVFHEVYRKPFLKIAKHLMKKGIPYIILPHGALTREVQRKKRLKKIVGNIFLFNRFIKNAKAIQCLSEHEQGRIDFKVKTFVSISGIYMPEKSKGEFSKDGTKINYIGRLEMHTKGLDLMAKAIALKADFLRENNCKINIYGPDILDRRKALQELICEQNIQDIVILNDAVTGEEKEKIILGTDIFIQTSRTEALPLGILEALSYGVPCLVTRGTTFGELVKKYDAGWVAENNVESIAEKLQQAIEERALWKQKSAGARKGIQGNYEWAAVAQNTLKEYRRYL